MRSKDPPAPNTATPVLKILRQATFNRHGTSSRGNRRRLHGPLGGRVGNGVWHVGLHGGRGVGGFAFARRLSVANGTVLNVFAIGFGSLEINRIRHISHFIE